MAASSHALGLATPSLTKWTLTSGSSTSSCCSATCIPAGHSPAALRLACSSSGGVRPLNLQARHATAVDGEVSTQQSSGSLVALEEELRTEVAVEVEGESSPEPSQQQQQPRQQRSNNVRRGKRGGAATTKPEELVEGAVFPGTVRTVTNYGAFVDIGAFTDGLVHISQLSDSYVAQVQDLVSVGQQVSVRILEADLTSGRISLSMRPAASSAPEAEAAPAPSGSGTARTPGERRKIAGRGASKPGGSAASSKPSVTKGQTVTGVVKNVTRTGIFLTLSTGDEGFLRVADISIDNPTNLALESLVQVGQELEVRVQRIDARGKVSLTQKREVDIKRLNASINNNEEAGAVNPFELVFRQSNLLNVNGDGAVANEEAEVVVEPVSVPEAAIEETVAEDTVEKEEVLAVVEDHAEEKIPEPAVAAPEAAKEKEVVAEETSAPEAAIEEVVVEEPALPVAEAVAEAETSDEVAAPEGHLQAEEASQVGEEAAVSEEAAEVGAVAEAEPTEVVAAVEETSPVPDVEAEKVVDEPAAAVAEPETAVEEVGGEEPVAEAEPTEVVAAVEVTSPVPDVEAEKVVDEPAASVAEPEAAVEEVGGEEPVAEAEPTEVVAAVEETSPVPDVEAEKVVDEPAASVAEPEAAVEEVGGEEPVAEAEPNEVVAAVEETSPVPDVEAEKVVDEPAASVAEPEAAVDEVGGEEPVAEAEPTVVVAENVEPVVAESDAAAPAEEPSSPVAVVEPPALEPVSSSVSPSITAAAAAVIVSPALVKELRQVSGAGMMECKKALVACSNDLEKAADYLRKKGLASADKKASRVAAEGAIGSYIHDGRIGVLIEVNSETDFVARGDRFKELVQDLAMQVAAYPQVEYVSVEDIPAEIGEAERKIESAKDDLANKPEAVRSKIVDGRVNKILKELSLLDQPYIRNDKVLVQDHIKETIAALGENLQVRRFKRFNLGEGIEKKKTDFAAEVAEQTKPKEPKAEAPQKAPESQQDEAAPAVVVSAAAVKELRQGTGAGMMECKKALAACGNDLEKATEYLRKKGLASAEKKASRVAAEGVIGKYIHDGRIGVLIEVNCETDFVARGERFKELVQDLAMQVVACPQVTVVSVDDVPAEVAEKERELESQRDDVLSKPEAVRSRIVDGRIAKRLAELALLEQPYIRNDKVLVKDHVKETIAALGENIQVRRFVKFVLGEGIEKKKVDFAAEVAAQTKGLQP